MRARDARRSSTASTRARARAAGAGTRPRAEREHREPQVALVIEREIAIAGARVRGQVEQQQPADAGRERRSPDSRVAVAGTDRAPGKRRRATGRARARAPPPRASPRRTPPGIPASDAGVAREHRSRARRPAARARDRPTRPRPTPQRDAVPIAGRDAAAREVQEREADDRERGPLPARGVQERAHRVVLRPWARGCPGFTGWRNGCRHADARIGRDASAISGCRGDVAAAAAGVVAFQRLEPGPQDGDRGDDEQCLDERGANA